MAGNSNKVTVDITTGVGILSFPRVFASTADKNDKGEPVYNIQFLIPKAQKDDVRALLAAIKKVGEAKWGDKWKQVRMPLRDGDREKDELTEDGSTKGEKYPERLGHYFLNARTNRPVGVFDRALVPITNPDELYGGCVGKISVSFYPYSTSGNHGIGVGLNGVQKIRDGESFGGGRPSVESMFDILDEEDDVDLDDTDDADKVDEEPTSKKRTTKKTATKKTTASRKKAEPIEVDEDEDDLYGDLDDLDED